MRIGLICQYFPPEMAPMGFMISELAHDLAAAGHTVTVFTGYPNHPAGRLMKGYRCRLGGQDERRDDGVTVRRNWLYVSPSKSVVARLFNYASFGVSSLLSTMARRHDVYLIVSPPFTNVLVGFLLRLAGRHYVLNVQDIYPDAAVATGMLRNKALIRILSWIERLAYRKAEKIAVISSGFVRNLAAKGVPREKIALIPNWIDADEIRPQPRKNAFSVEHGIDGAFTVLYSGTVGLVSGAEIVAGAAELLQDEPGITVMMVGEGIVKARIEEQVRAKGIANMRFLPFQPRAILSDVLSSASVGLITLKPGYGGNSVPSKILGYLAAARPVIASVEPGSDTWEFVEEAGCGLCVPPGDAEALAGAIRRLHGDAGLCERLGADGRRYLEENLGRSTITAKYAEALCPKH